MAENKNLFSNDPKGKRGKKTSPWVYVGVVGGAGLVYYLYKKYSASSSTASTATTAAIDPLTGQPYAPGVGSLAPGGSSGISGSSPTGTDPATGQPYSSELATAQGTVASQNTLITQLQSIITGFSSGTIPSASNPPPISTTVGSTGSDVTGGTTPGATASGGTSGAPRPVSTLSPLDIWRSDKAAVIAKAEGITSAQAGQAISQYLQGKPITNAAAARGISNVIKNSGPPPTGRTQVLPVRVAAQPIPARAPATPVTPAKK